MNFFCISFFYFIQNGKSFALLKKELFCFNKKRKYLVGIEKGINFFC
jgi:hypothetical protein